MRVHTEYCTRNARAITCSAVAGRRRIKVEASPAAGSTHPTACMYLHLTYYHLTLPTLCRNDMRAFSTRSVIIILYNNNSFFFLIYFTFQRSDVSILNGSTDPPIYNMIYDRACQECIECVLREIATTEVTRMYE